MMKQRWVLDRINVLRHLKIPGESNNTTEIQEQKKTTNRKYNYYIVGYAG